MRRLDRPGVLRYEALHRGVAAQALGDRHRATRSATKPIGSNHSRLNHLLEPTRTRGAMPFDWGTEPAQVAVSMTSSPGVSCDR